MDAKRAEYEKQQRELKAKQEAEAEEKKRKEESGLEGAAKQLIKSFF